LSRVDKATFAKVDKATLKVDIVARAGRRAGDGAALGGSSLYVLAVTPYTLHPTPYTLHPTLYTPHSTPYSLRPTPHTPHPTPRTLHTTPHTPHPTPYAGSGSGRDGCGGAHPPGVAALGRRAGCRVFPLPREHLKMIHILLPI